MYSNCSNCKENITEIEMFHVSLKWKRNIKSPNQSKVFIQSFSLNRSIFLILYKPIKKLNNH